MQLLGLRPALCASWAPEVLGQQAVDLEGLHETIDLLFHVGSHETAQVADERLRPAVELLVELLDDDLLEDAGADRLAVGAAQRDLPMGRASLFPLQRVDEVGLTRSADVEVGLV